MSRSTAARAAFVAISATALAVLGISTACTRRGGNGVTPPTSAPITTYYVNPVSGNDSNSGTASSTPFKTIHKALATVEKTMTSGLTISLAAGTYSTASGETFPIVVPVGVIIAGNNYGRGPMRGSLIKGFGEDVSLEKALGKPAQTYYATIEVPSSVSVSVARIYVSGGRVVMPAGAQFASVDDLGTLTGSQVTLGILTSNGHPAGGILVPSGTLDCTACSIGAFNFGIEAFSVPSATTPPTLILSGPGQSIIGGAQGIRTDGTANITASSQSFESRVYAYSDALAAPTASPSATPSSSASAAPSPGTIDFGYGANGSLGGNVFIGSMTEMSVVLPGAVISARNDTWNVAQGTNRSGRYAAIHLFRAGASGKNVTISAKATGALVDVGPAPPPTQTPSPTPSASASPSATASST
jgi:Protein of unknown function (DUF1565)